MGNFAGYVESVVSGFVHQCECYYRVVADLLVDVFADFAVVSAIAIYFLVLLE